LLLDGSTMFPVLQSLRRAALVASKSWKPVNVHSTLVACRKVSSTSPGWFKGQNLLSASQFDRERIDYFVNLAQEMRQLPQAEALTLLRGKVQANLFFEPSTRTASSFHGAMLRLGGSVIPVNSNTSSAEKGETLQDTIRTMENYVDVLVLRHPMVGAADLAAEYASKPVINSGDGQGEHPTQALLDIVCMTNELGKRGKPLDGCTITFVGDLKYGRTVHSLSQLIQYFDVNVNLISPEELRMPSQYKTHLPGHVNEGEDLMEVIGSTDVLYVTRVQKERFESAADYFRVKGSYLIDESVLDAGKPDMIVMHPLPRVDEISEAIDKDKRACYFKQVEYGIYTRMGILAAVLGAR